jgi:hypothetical protein
MYIFAIWKLEFTLLLQQYDNVTNVENVATYINFVWRNNNASHAEKKNMVLY